MILVNYIVKEGLIPKPENCEFVSTVQAKMGTGQFDHLAHLFDKNENICLTPFKVNLRADDLASTFSFPRSLTKHTLTTSRIQGQDPEPQNIHPVVNICW